MGFCRLSLNLFSVLLVISVIWKPAFTDDKCSLACKGSASAPTFLNGHKYSYALDGVVSIYLTGADKQETSVKVLGQVSVVGLGNCANELTIQNLAISGPDGKKYSAPPGLDKPVRFSLQDGRLGADLCAVNDDTRRSLNIKRAIISLLQTEQKASTELDIFGACPTEVSSSQEGGAQLVHRSRDLSRCAHREQGKTDLLTSVYNPTAEIKNTQVLQSVLNVESKVNNGIPEKVAASEEYLYKPFSVGENGARALVNTKLTLTGKANGAPSATVADQRRTIIFENPHGVSSQQNNYDNALSAVKDTAKALASEASSKSAGNFAQLVRILRTTSKDDLLKVYGAANSPIEKRVFLDGLLRAGTGDSIEASIVILKKNQLSPLERELTLLSLGNAKHVHDDAIKAATSLLDLPNLPKGAYLGVGALAGTYCRDHNCHHTKPEGIVVLSQKLAAKLQNYKPKNKADEDKVVAILTGIQNIRHLEDNLVNKVVAIAADKNAKARVRVAALEAFLADPCAAKVKKTALDLLKDRNLDSEIRIKAYLAVIGCPCGKTANEIKNLLESEPVHQVGAYITSSLRHIRSSANPDKQLQRQHYGQIRTPNKFNVDDRKYSYYREVSYNVDALGLGGSVEQSVIFSQDSFVPRSASLNLTTELFGHNINVLEIGGRQGNLDRVIEHFLGPKGLLKKGSLSKLSKDLGEKYNEFAQKLEQKLRGRRSVKSEVDNFDKKLKAEAVQYNDELDLDLYVKLFGTDAVFLSLGDQNLNADKIIDELLKVIAGGVNQVKHFQQEVRANLLFLDAELAYPTSTGLPLKLDLVGAATARVELVTNVDINQILHSPQNAKLEIKLVPSTDIEIAGLFLVDADAVSTGLKVVTNLHSSTGGHVIAKVLENGRGIDLQLGLPVDKQEIVTASNDLVFITTEKGHKEKAVALKIDADKKEYAGCFDQLSGVLGLTLCGDISVPFSVSGPEAQASVSKFLARYPLTGSSKVKLVLEKNDLRGYHVKGVLRNDNKGKQNFELLFEAQGSKNRKTHLTGDLVNTDVERTVRLVLDSPIKYLSGEVSLLNKPNELSGLVRAKIINRSVSQEVAEYYARAGFTIQGSGDRVVYKPLIEYQLPDENGKQNLKVDGQLVKETSPNGQKFTLQGVKITVPNTNDVVLVDGHLENNKNGIDFDLKAKKAEHNVLLSGALQGPIARLEFQNTLNPNINFKINGHFENGETVSVNRNHGHYQIHNDIDLYYGGDLRNPHNRVVLNQLLKYNAKSLQDGLITKNKFEILALPLKLKLDGEVDAKKIDLEIEGQYLNKKAELDLEARTEIKKPGDYSVKLTANVDKQGLEILAKKDIVSDEKSNLENYVLIKNVGKYELSGVVLHKYKQNDINVGAIGHLKVSGSSRNEDIKFDIGVVSNEKLYSSHAKIAGSKGELLDYLLKITIGANPSGTLKLNIKDAISANGQYKVTDGDGKGNGVIIIDFNKSERKIKGDVKFVAKEPVFNADVDLYLNYEKDNNDKIQFSTKTSYGKVLDTKNKLKYAGQETELNVRLEGAFKAAGKNRADIEIVLPTQRVLGLKFDRDVSIENDVVNGNAQLLLSDATKRGGPQSTITYKGKVQNSNFDKETINYEGQIQLKLKDGRNLDNEFNLKHNPEQNDRFKYEFKTEVKGNLIPQPASLVASGTYAEDLLDINEDYRLKGNYGSDIGFELTGKTESKLDDGGDKKYLDDSTLVLRLPFEKAHDIKWVSYILLLQPKGNAVAEYTISQAVQVNAEQYKIDANGKLGLKAGNAKVKVLVAHVDPFVLDLSYKSDLESNKKSASVDLNAQYGKGKTAHLGLEASAAANDYFLQIKGNAPQAEKFKKLLITIRDKVPSPNTNAVNLVVDVDGQQYKVDSLVVYSKVNPVIDIKYSCPKQQKQSRIFLKGDSLSSSQGKVEVKVDNVRDISFDGSLDANIQKDNLDLKLVGNSNELGLKNYKVAISSKDAGNGKRLEFHATNDNKNILTGSTSFISKQEGPKTIIEGSGSVKVKEEQKSANFKYIRTLLTEGNEQGVETFLNLAIGERSYVAEYRVTNLEYKNAYVYCEEKKQCANVEFQSKVNTQTPGLYQHLVNVEFDLRKLGFAPEFGLQISNDISDKKLPQYKLDLHVNKADKRYHLNVYSTPELGKFPAGIVVNLPQRTLALETLLVYPTGGKIFPVKGDVTLNLDKNQPNKKSAARFLVDFNENGQDAVAEFAYSHPKLNKEALLKIRGNVGKSEKGAKISGSAVVSHPALGGDRESKVYLEYNPTSFKLQLATPIVQVIDVQASAGLSDNLQQVDLKFSLLQGKPVVVRGVIKEFQYYEFTTGYSGDGDRRISIIGHLEPEKRVDISADIILPGGKKNIVHGALFIQDKLVKSDYGISKENFNYFAQALQNDLKTLQVRIQELGDKASNDLKETLKKLQPSLQQLETAYEEEIKKIYEEISNDKTLKEIITAVGEVYEFIEELVLTVIKALRPITAAIRESYGELSKKFLEVYEKQIEPQLKQLYKNIATILQEYFEGLLDLVAHYAALISEFFEKHKPELQELTNTITEIFKDITKLVVAQLKELRVRAAEIFKDLTEQLENLPIVGLLKQKWQELAVPEQALGLIQEAYKTIRQFAPTEETKILADALYDYTQKKLSQQKVDDSKALREIYEKLVTAAGSLLQLVRAQLNQLGIPTLTLNALPFYGPSQLSAPSLGGSASLSLLNNILRGDVPDPIALLKSYRPRSLNPLDEFPSKLRGVVVNGQHIFTFDGRHLTFPGTCRYVLVHDHVDRNFSLILQLNKGKPKTIILEDKSGSTVELKENGQTALNGANHPYPIIEGDVFAFRETSGRIGIGSTYGILVRCTSKLEVCYIEVNGFYLGKLRGLLGDGNNEPYDDFRLPDGKIAQSESDFGNGYRLASSCPAASAPEHSHHQHHAELPPACEQVFGASSPLRPLSLVLDVAPFRQACIHAVTADSANALREACDLAAGYAALAVTGLLPAVLPPACVQCTDAGKPRNVGDTYELKLPNKQADIIVGVETTVPNTKNFNELVIPLVGQLVDALKSKQITDIKVYLVGISPKLPYPILYDTDLKLKNPKVKFDDATRYADLTNSLVPELQVQLGLTNVVAGYSSLLSLPLRPGAVKHAINVVGERCKSQFFLIQFFRALSYKTIFEEIAYTHTLVTGSEDLALPEGGNIVGFTDDSILKVGEKKLTKKPEGQEDIDQGDACVDFVELSGGLVLPSSSYFKQSPEARGPWLQSAVGVITQRLLKESLVQECVCGYSDPFVARSTCVNKDRKEATRRRK